MKTKQSLFKNSALLMVLSLSLIICVGCSKDESSEPSITGTEPPTEEEQTNFNTVLASLQSFEQESEAATEEVSEPENPERNPDDVTEECVVQRYKTSPGFDEMLSLDPTTDVIYPGAMLKGESIPTGEYIGINGGRAPITLSVSLQNIDGTSSVEIEDPKLSTVREGVNSVLQQGVTGATAAKLNFTIEEVYSEQHLSVALGANYRTKNRDVSASFNFDNSQYSYKYVIKYFQEYYTIDLDLPPNNNPGSLFYEMPVLNSTSPVIVSSVKYGRMVLYTVESNSSITDVQSAFNASFNSANANGNAEYQSIINNSKIEALVVGGSGSDAAGAVSGPAGVYEYITNGGNYSADSPAAPLAYTLRYIRNDFPVARVVLSSEYNIRTCYEAYQKYRIELGGIEMISHAGESGDLSLRGNLNIKLFQGGQQMASESYTRTSNNYISIREGVFWSIPGDEASEVELYKPDLENDYVQIEAEFSEDDLFSSNEYLGKNSRKIYLKDIKMNFDDNGNAILQNEVLKLEEDSGSDFEVTFYMSRIY
ncbi:thiol-activated cytolysin family protein [[Muricauda] lutisoli]|uniref:Thiol-activated cytolysin family protein n=1 Tax=[Muricauda] lutisoli TaxID=2816035 RepID=A0ABS3EUD1_9FLAO|nr:thiol-activated cytolysin family protein [[Muricauda] lutisoli]MBO0329855.1 thiol-activated cytolysin family protein [[Muricauda] lutisoli]